MRIALATCLRLPEPDPDAPLLAAALAARGHPPTLAAWDDPAVDWASFDLVVLRSTWNYHRHPAAFLAWVDRVAGLTRLENPAPLVRRNAHKGYLLDLAARGLPVIPTALLPAGSGQRLAEVLACEGWREVVVKPAVSAGSHGALRVGPGDLARGEAHLASLLAVEDALVQPFLEHVVTWGELSVVVIDGAPSHCVRKRARFAGEDERAEPCLAMGDDAVELARRALARAGAEGALYGRVDMTRDAAGSWRLMELELIEPSLFFEPAHDPDGAALDRFVGAILRRTEGDPGGG
ncbi:MAG: hypothetical protein KIT58_23340 [Planctomycetota bacterium]|nr:hypothetical protein [Planctomycetota bacterium]